MVLLMNWPPMTALIAHIRNNGASVVPGKVLKTGAFLGSRPSPGAGALRPAATVTSPGDMGAAAQQSGAGGRLGGGGGCPGTPAWCCLGVSTAEPEPPSPCGSVALGLPAPLPGASAEPGQGGRSPAGVGSSCLA